MGQPWLAGWNFRVLQWLFHLLRHSGTTDNFFDYLTRNHLITTWVFAAAFYLYWSIEDEQTAERRTRLAQIVVTFVIAVIISLVARRWAAWPAPALNPQFQALYPNYFWGYGVFNSFPSHATLTYFLIGLGLWPLSRRASVALALYALLGVALPRVYVGGHYPIDVIASVILDVVVLAVVWQWRVPASVRNWLTRRQRAGWRELLVVFWVFELGEEFGGLTQLAHTVQRWLHL